MKTQTEGSARFNAPEGAISKRLPVFYNPVMEFNRTTAVLLIKALGNIKSAGLPMSGTGVRGIRILKETGTEEVVFNDISPAACKLIGKNLKINGLEAPVACSDANQFLLQSRGFDYIDIDPFGTPNPFIDSAVRRIKNNGILAVTATDTAPLCGTYPKACMRKYWAHPLRNELMHELGLRILIRKIQLISAQYEKAAVPVFSYYRHHYFRVYLQTCRGKSRADDVLRRHGRFHGAGPMWLGRLWQEPVAKKLAESGDPYLQMIYKESKVDAAGFYDIHAYAKRLKLNTIPRLAVALEKMPGSARTHFSPYGIRSTISEEKFIRLLGAHQ